MQNGLRLLIVEDDSAAIKMYEQQIDSYNRKNEIKIIQDIKKNRTEGLEALKEDYDAAIIDIKLSSIDSKDNGNQIIREIKRDLRFPVRVYTAFENIDDDLKDQNEFYKIYKRTGENSRSIQEILKELVAIYKTGITKILGKRGTIEGYLKDIFWNHLSASFGNWVREAQTEDNVEKILLRHTLSHLREYLDISDSGGFDNYHPAEVYIKKPINSNIHTGLILKKNDDGQSFIVLTPSCDLAQQKANKIVLAPIENKDMPYVKDLKSKKEKASEEEVRNQAEKALDGLLRNNHALKYHCLPEVNGVGGFINFQKISSFTVSQIRKDFQPVATVTDKFCKDIIARFSHYYARQGQPDFNIDKLYDLMYK